MGNYTIKGLAKANDCAEHDILHLAYIWEYWRLCGQPTQALNDFMRLNKKSKYLMMCYLSESDMYQKLYKYIANNYFALQ